MAKSYTTELEKYAQQYPKVPSDVIAGTIDYARKIRNSGYIPLFLDFYMEVLFARLENQASASGGQA